MLTLDPGRSDRQAYRLGMVLWCLAAMGALWFVAMVMEALR